MSSEFNTAETELQFLLDDPSLSLGGMDSALEEILQAISADDYSPGNRFEPQLESLSLGQANQLQPLPTNAAVFSPPDGFLQSFSGGYDQVLPHSYSGESLSSWYLPQRSHSSSRCFGEKPRPVAMQSALPDGFPNSPDFQRQNIGCSSPGSSPFGGHMRRVYSTGDLQSPVAVADGSPVAVGEASFKVARYSAEQRKERILKYRAKRTQRNFNKTIKYACRKTLADNRPRIRGRFARNDETGDVPKAASSATTDDDDDEFWVGLHEEGQWSHGTGTTIHDGRVADGPVPNSAAVNRLVEALCRSVW